MNVVNPDERRLDVLKTIKSTTANEKQYKKNCEQNLFITRVDAITPLL